MSVTPRLVATVFGATGFTGKYVVSALAEADIQVVVPFRGEERSYRDLKVLGELGQIVPVRFDIRDEASIHTAVSRSNIVINLISRFWETRNFSFEDVNVKAPISIAKAVRANPQIQRFVHFSSACVSKDSPSKWARTKAIGEEEVKNIVPNATIFKPTVICGDEDRLLNRGGALCGKTLAFYPLWGRGKLFQPFDVGDLGAAVVKSLHFANNIPYEFVLGGPEQIAWEDFHYKVLKECKLQPQYGNLPDDYESNLTFDVPIKWLAKYGKITQYMTWKDPLFPPDEILHFDQDLIVKPGDLGFSSLHIRPRSIQRALQRVIRGFRKPESVPEAPEVPPIVRR